MLVRVRTFILKDSRKSKWRFIAIGTTKITYVLYKEKIFSRILFSFFFYKYLINNLANIVNEIQKFNYIVLYAT